MILFYNLLNHSIYIKIKKHKRIYQMHTRYQQVIGKNGTRLNFIKQSFKFESCR